jgi:low temperature requirement protein LtrA
MPVELFFDLVYVLAVTQLTHHLRDHLSPRGAAETLLLLLAVWGAWIHTTWLTNYFDRGTRPVRLALIGVMLASLIMSAALPDAFAARGLAFAAALAVILVRGNARRPARRRPPPPPRPRLRPRPRLVVGDRRPLARRRRGQRRGDGPRLVVAVALTYVVMWIGFPGARFRPFQHDRLHDRRQPHGRALPLFVILALGESILLTGTTFGDDPVTLPATAAFVVAFIGSATLWWLYFDRAKPPPAASSPPPPTPARLALSAYTYGHIPLVAASSSPAAADEMTIAHPIDPAPTRRRR